MKTLWTIGLGTALVFGGMHMALGPQPAPSWMDRVILRVAFFHALRQASSEIKNESQSGDSGVYYFTSYYLHGILSAAEATRSDYVLKKALTPLDRMLSKAQSVTYKGIPYQAWGPFGITPYSELLQPNVHYTLQAIVPMARAAALIQQDPAWRARYGDKSRRYSAFVRQVVVDYWYVARFDRRIPWLDTEHVPIWNDNATNMGLAATFLYESTGDPMAREIALAVGQAFQAKLAPAGRGWIWESHTIPIGSDTDNTPGSVGNQAGVPDTSHTNREPFLVIALHEAKLMFNETDIERMGYTLVDSIWNQSYKNPSFANYMNGSNKPYRVYKEPGLNGPIYHGWVLVGGYVPAAQRVMVATLKAILRGERNPSLERNATSYGGILGMTGHLLRNESLLKRRGSSPR